MFIESSTIYEFTMSVTDIATHLQALRQALESCRWRRGFHFNLQWRSQSCCSLGFENEEESDVIPIGKFGKSIRQTLYDIAQFHDEDEFAAYLLKGRGDVYLEFFFNDEDKLIIESGDLKIEDADTNFQGFLEDLSEIFELIFDAYVEDLHQLTKN